MLAHARASKGLLSLRRNQPTEPRGALVEATFEPLCRLAGSQARPGHPQAAAFALAEPAGCLSACVCHGPSWHVGAGLRWSRALRVRGLCSGLADGSGNCELHGELHVRWLAMCRPNDWILPPTRSLSSQGGCSLDLPWSAPSHRRRWARVADGVKSWPATPDASPCLPRGFLLATAPGRSLKLQCPSACRKAAAASALPQSMLSARHHPALSKQQGRDAFERGLTSPGTEFAFSLLILSTLLRRLWMNPRPGPKRMPASTVPAAKLATVLSRLDILTSFLAHPPWRCRPWHGKSAARPTTLPSTECREVTQRRPHATGQPKAPPRLDADRENKASEGRCRRPYVT